MTTTTTRLFADQGAVLAKGGNRPFLLDDPAGVWMIEAGAVDVFAVRVEAGEAQGARRHLFRMRQGQALFGVATVPGGFGLLAVGAMGTQLRAVKRSWLEVAATTPDHAGEVQPFVDDWIEAFSGGIVRGVPPGDFIPLIPDREGVLDAGSAARVRSGVCWVKCLDGKALFLSRPELAPLESGDSVPLCRHTWIETVAPSRMATASTLRLAERGAVWDALDAFHVRMRDALAVIDTRLERVARERFEKRQASDQAALQSAFARLASILRKDEAPPPAFETKQGALMATCRMVGEQMGIDIQAPQDAKAAHNRRDPVGSIARASRVRVRKVLLAGTWWKEDNGPLLAQYQDDRRPVALLLDRRARYEIYDPSLGTREPLRPEVAEQLMAFGYSFYRPFPRKVLTVWDVLKHGLHGSYRDLALMLGMGLAAGLLAMVTPIATGVLFDTVIPEAERGQLIQIMMVLLVTAGAMALFGLTRNLAMLRIESKMEASTQAAVQDRLLELPTSFFRDYTAGELASRSQGISGIRRLLSGAVISSILSGIFSLFNVSLLFYYSQLMVQSTTMAWYAMGLVFAVLGITVGLSYIKLHHSRRVARLRSLISGRVLQFITGIAKLRVAGAEPKAFSLWAAQFSEQREMQFKERMISVIHSVINGIFPLVALIVIFYKVNAMGVELAMQGHMISTGYFLAFNASFSAFLVAVLAMNGALMGMLQAIPLYELARPILETLPEITTTKNDPGDLNGEIELQHISFRYDPEGVPILNDLTIHARPGEFIALVGPSGSGKSTVLRMLLGFEKPEAGAVYFDGQDLAGLDVQAVRRQIGVVLQDGKLLPGDIFTNIIGASLATLEDAWEAARMAGFDTDIKQMPMGMHTVVSGNTLSGGQRQRLMIARAIVAKPRLLFFDEATSALDNHTQTIVSESLERLQATRVVVAHRLSTIQNADRIYVIRAGKVVEAGTFAVLMEKEGLFAELARRQMI